MTSFSEDAGAFGRPLAPWAKRGPIGLTFRCLGQSLNFFTTELQSDAIGKLFELLGVDGHNLGADAKRTTNFDLNGLDRAVLPFGDFNHLAHVSIVGAING